MFTANKFTEIMGVVSKDLGNRGIETFVDFNALEKGCLKIDSAENIVVISGFTIPQVKTTETDGPIGSLSIIKSLLHLKKNVFLVVDDFSMNIFESAVKYMGFSEQVKLVSFPFEDSETFCENFLKESKPDLMISLERPGPSYDGVYRSMSAREASFCNAPTHLLFEQKPKECGTVAVGDGGNELGMGKFYDSILEHVKFGKEIACTVPAEEVIVCGVSNWGGEAISAGLFLLHHRNNNDNKEEEKEEKVDDFLITNTEHKGLLDAIVESGSIDGCSFENIPSVDGMAFEVHEEILNQIREIAISKKEKKKE